MGDLPQGSGYDPARGARVIAWARKFLDDSFPLTAGSHADAREYRIAEGALVVAMADGTTAGLKESRAIRRPCWGCGYAQRRASVP